MLFWFITEENRLFYLQKRSKPRKDAFVFHCPLARSMKCHYIALLQFRGELDWDTPEAYLLHNWRVLENDDFKSHVKLPRPEVDVLPTTFSKHQEKFCCCSKELFFLKSMRADVRTSSWADERNSTRSRQHFYQDQYGPEGKVLVFFFIFSM